MPKIFFSKYVCKFNNVVAQNSARFQRYMAQIRNIKGKMKSVGIHKKHIQLCSV